MKNSHRKNSSRNRLDRWENGSAGKPKRGSIGKRKWESRAFKLLNHKED